MELDQDACYRAVKGRDRRFDGVFYTAVRTTGIYCRPSCPAITPAAPQRLVLPHRRRRPGRRLPGLPPLPARRHAGLTGVGRRGRRRRPGRCGWSPTAWSSATASTGSRSALGYSTRQLNRVVTQEYGAGPLALARSRRAQTARVLIETTDLSFADIAFAAGFASVRQFNDTVREVYAATPTRLRAGRRPGAAAGTRPGTIRTRIAVREPFAADDLHLFLAVHAVRGIEAAGPGLVRTLAAAPARSRRRPPRARPTGRPGQVPCTFTLADARDLAPAAGAHPPPARRRLRPGRRRRGAGRGPGARAARGRDGPGCGCPVTSTAPSSPCRRCSASRSASPRPARPRARLVEEHGEPLDLDGRPRGHPPVPDRRRRSRRSTPRSLRMPRSRGRALTGLAAALDGGEVRLDRSTDRAETRAALLALPGIGPWTADYVAMRALGDPDVFLPTDVGRAQRRRPARASTT